MDEQNRQPYIKQQRPMFNSKHQKGPVPRRAFLKTVLTGTGAVACADGLLLAESVPDLADRIKRPYTGPNVIIVRFGGGARRRETIEPQFTYAPFLCREFARRGTLFSRMEIDSFTPTVGVDTSHGQGTLYIVTGKYEKYKDITEKFLAERFESKVPTIFEYLRKSHDVPDYQTLIVNGEDRTNEEFYTFSNHHLYGINYRSNTLSLYRYKTFLLRKSIQAGKWTGKELEKKRQELAKLERIDYRNAEPNGQGPELVRFWERWREYYGESGLVNPRGDRLLTELSIRALKELRPKLLMVNFQDCDYVHWGNLTHYTRAIAIMDDGVKQLVATVEADPEYRDNTIFVVVPDCGRDNNPMVDVPCQHHFNSRSSHEIFALLVGPGVPRGTVVDRRTDQISIAGTIGRLMGIKTEQAESRILEEAFA